ncbi:MAG: putative transporter transrane protein [Frankiales bacterium]|nr:putative transporter transrane protein [Frankiales bacterium]
MTTTAARASAVPSARLSGAGILRSEWTKLRSLRSTVWSFVVALVLLVGVSALISAAVANDWSRHPEDQIGFDATSTSIAGGFLAQLAIGVLGVLLISGEYSTGMIRSTMAAVPRRLPALWGKLAVFVALTYVTMQIATLAAFALGQRLLRSTGASVRIGDPEILRALVGAALYLTVVGILGMGLGALLRHSAGAISVLVGVLLVLPIIVAFLPGDLQTSVRKFLPGEAGQQVLMVVRDPAQLMPWTGFALFLGYALAVIAVAAVLLKRRDV